MRNWASDSDTEFHVCLISFENVYMTWFWLDGCGREKKANLTDRLYHIV